MTEVRTPVQTINISKLCECGKGYMIGTMGGVNWGVPVDQLTFHHKCSSCGSEARFPKRYPTIEYEIIKD